MKKSTLALSVAAALGGFGMVGSALAVTTVNGGAATTLAVNPYGIGHQLVIPYFSTQGDNATLINITNTDTTAGKVVKVRFRGAANSDDLYDFQILMSPADVWTGSITQDADTGLSKLVTADNTCTLPATVRTPGAPSDSLFSTGRTDPTPVKGTVANQTREGYVEIINMADIPGTSSDLFKAIVHKAGVPTCDATVLQTRLGTDYTDSSDAGSVGMMAPPSGKLTSDWIILNQTNTAAWSGTATALEARDANGASSTGNLVFWPQKLGQPEAPIASYTADPLMGLAATAIVQIQNYDLPDLSTPYVAGDATPEVRANATANALAVDTVINQYVTNAGIHAVTDLLFSQPTRRYAVAVDYATPAIVWNAGGNQNHYWESNGGPGTSNVELKDRQICLNSLKKPSRFYLFDREEGTPGTSTTGFVISPNIPGKPEAFPVCGEVAVTSVNTGALDPSALNASVVRTDLSVPGYVDGWMKFDTAGAKSNGLPILGASFIRASNGLVNYGFAWTHKTIKNNANPTVPGP